MPIYAKIIIGCWLILIGYWIVSAFTTKAIAERGSFASTLLYRLPLIIGGIMIGTFRVWHPP
jgi:hypothetical protein